VKTVDADPPDADAWETEEPTSVPITDEAATDEETEAEAEAAKAGTRSPKINMT
jgi:hypothetical protein